ncbi:MAG: transposase [Gammaproteobacteria bacterium]
MPRQSRIAIAEIPWHIVQRGNNRSACFFAAADYHFYLATLSSQAARWRCAIHAYALMTNHVHLLVTPATVDGPSLLMKHLGQRYVQYVNRNYQRSGTLWEGRFRSCLAQSETYALACQRYIELNPVRAGMVTSPGEYPWSSHRANAFDGDNDLLSPHPSYLALAPEPERRRARYRRLFDAGLDDDTLDRIRRATNGNYALGNERFEDEIADALARRVTPGKPGRPRKEK